MAQHFLLSRPAKSLSLAQVFRLSDAEAETMFAKAADGRRAGLLQVRRLERLWLPAPERCPAFPLPRLQGRFLDYLGDAVRFP